MSNFPYTHPTDLDEVIAFMAGVGATQTWTNSIYPYTEYHPALISWMQFGDPTCFVGTPADAIATWRMNEADRQDTVFTDWEASISTLVPGHGLYGTKVCEENHKFLLIDKAAAVLTAAGYLRTLTAATVALYMIFDRRRRADFGAIPPDALLVCARVASIPNLTFDQRKDCIWRNLPLDEVERLLGTGLPYSHVQELFAADPYTWGGVRSR